MNRVWCKDCQNHVDPRNNGCPSRTCHGSKQSSNVVGEVLDTAVDVALAYTGVTAAVEVADAVGGLVGSIFNWD